MNKFTFKFAMVVVFDPVLFEMLDDIVDQLNYLMESIQIITGLEDPGKELLQMKKDFMDMVDYTLDMDGLAGVRLKKCGCETKKKCKDCWYVKEFIRKRYHL